MAPRHRFSSRKNASILSWLGVSFIIILLDQLSKIAISKILIYGEPVRVTSFFNLNLAYNKGAAFSFLASASGWQHYFFIAISVFAVVFILYLLKRHPDARLFCMSLALILGGAIGNLIDRIRYGHVVDFIDIYVGSWHWPTFNIADAAITIGAILFILDELKRVNRSR